MCNNIESVKAEVIRNFKLSGYQIRSDLSKFLAEKIYDLDKEERNKWIKKVTEHIQTQNLTYTNIEKDNLDLAIAECIKFDLSVTETIFDVINAFDVPNYKYDILSKMFVLDTKANSLLANAKTKPCNFIDRYVRLWQITSRHPSFVTSSDIVFKNVSENQRTLRKIETLLTTSIVESVYVLGLLTQLTEGKYYIEDPTATVPIDLTTAVFTDGLFCEGCFVVVHGRYKDDILKVLEVKLPPGESAINTSAFYGTDNYWGGSSKVLLKQSARLAEIEMRERDATIVFLSDCWLNNPTVVAKLKSLFVGYNASPPVAIVLMGPFSNKELTDIYSLKTYFNYLADIIGDCNTLKEKTDVIIVPSMDDPVTPNILPRPPLPEFLVSDLKKKSSRVILASNPCRLQYCTQQILVARIDLVTKLCRNTLQFPETGDLGFHFAKTIITQTTLAPLNPITLPTYWNHKAILDLHPLPDLVVIGDPSQSFKATFKGCTVINTGSFSKSNYDFTIYAPSTKTIQFLYTEDEKK